MSLLDDVSIVVTPNGYKAGELYGVIPVPTEGSEEVTNGNFATDSDWNLGSSWSISGGKANYDAVSTGVELRQLMSSIDVGQLVNIVFEVSDIEDGKDAFFKLECSGAPESVFTYTKFSAGTYTYSHAITGGFNRLTFTALNSSTGGYFSIDNVSVKKYTSADMDVTRATDATRVNQSGLIENVLSNVPRIDYTGGGCPHILAEPQRTNIVFPSAVAVTQTRTVSATEYTLSFYGTGSVVLSGTHSATLNGTSVNNRVTLSFTPTAGSLTLTISGTVTNIQLEVGSYATSLIPTSGGTVTRNQDIFTRDGIGSLINSTEGTIFVEMAALANDSTNRYISINDGSSTNRIIFKFGTSSNNISALGLGTATSFSLSYSSATITNMNKIALKYKVNDCALWVNGVEVATDTTFTAYTANTLNQINFSNYASSGQFLDAKVKQLQVYKTALTDTQLAALTS